MSWTVEVSGLVPTGFEVFVELSGSLVLRALGAMTGLGAEQGGVLTAYSRVNGEDCV